MSCRNCRSQMCQTTVADVDKIGVTKNLIKMTGKYFSRRPFFVAAALLLHQKDTLEHGVSRELFEVFKNNFFIAQLRETSTSSHISSIKFSLWSKFHVTETYSKLSYTSKMNCLAKIFNDWKRLVIFAINSILDLWQDFQYLSVSVSQFARKLWILYQKKFIRKMNYTKQLILFWLNFWY